VLKISMVIGAKVPCKTSDIVEKSGGCQWTHKAVS